MTRLIILTLLLLGMMLPMKSSAATGTPTITLPMGKSSGNGGGMGREDDDSEDKRIPFARVMCTIDFVNSTVTGNFNSDLRAYEVWDEEGKSA